jgi:hypothetical protein
MAGHDQQLALKRDHGGIWDRAGRAVVQARDGAVRLAPCNLPVRLERDGEGKRHPRTVSVDARAVLPSAVARPASPGDASTWRGGGRETAGATRAAASRRGLPDQPEGPVHSRGCRRNGPGGRPRTRLPGRRVQRYLLEPENGDNRRVLAVLRYLRT